ncbi:WD40 repeat-like protein [Piedraia hortae CBS 480.64]|uniref:Pre-rRNA-processing protein IPI3 n=1 Tax=Piedraia hortae CBS 480.64 TaxID=1314780 RepID=A0A6A7C3C2_9PEZI|nr:WD40 repeat-like protein [Piedraia hortae CBS 480.64]
MEDYIAAIYLEKGTIHINDYPPQKQGQLIKNSSTPAHCLAVNESHIFAAQDKAVIHVYARGKGNQVATVAFNAKITSLAIAHDHLLIAGTSEGTIILWETNSGRAVTKPAAHLQSITALKVDPTENFILSASADSTVHVWSIVSLLSFANIEAETSQLRTFSLHRDEITAVDIGHSHGFCNFAVSASKDKTCMVWDYQSGRLLRTYLLPLAPTCLALDPADRAVYVGYNNGAIQRLDLYDKTHPMTPIQPGSRNLWTPTQDSGSALSITLSFDGCTLLSGHQSGSILAWDTATGRQLTPPSALSGPVSNIQFLPVVQGIGAQSIIKPKFEKFEIDGSVPDNYAIHVQVPEDRLPETLTHPSFTQGLLEEGLVELSRCGKAQVEEFVPVQEAKDTTNETLQLRVQIEALRRLQQASFDKIESLQRQLRGEGMRLIFFAAAAQALRIPRCDATFTTSRGAMTTTAAPSVTTYTVITPSPGASPVAVTAMSQVVTSFVPQFSVCMLNPVAFIPLSARPTAAYRNYSVSIPPGSGTCSTIYLTTETMVCNTTLTGIATTYPITNCGQDVTFSSQYGYELVTPTCGASPSIETLTTYYMAPWAALTAGVAPSNVVKAVCHPANGTVEQCVTDYEVWHTVLVPSTATTTLSVEVTAIVYGPGEIIIWETSVANITEPRTVLSVSTTKEHQFITHYTSISQNSASVSSQATMQTVEVMHAPSSTSSSSSDVRTTPRKTVTSTSTVHKTITITVNGTLPYTMR